MQLTGGGDPPRILTTRTACRLGITRAAIRHGIARHGWRPLARGVVLTASDGPTRSDWALTGLAIAGRSSALSGWDAVRYLGRGVASREPPTPDVLVLSRCGDNRRVGQVRIRVTARPFRTTTTSVLDADLPLTSLVGAARAIADTALGHRWLPPVRAMVAAAVQQGACTIEDLVHELESGPRNGSALLRRALEDLRDGARSAAEADAVQRLIGADVPAYELNVPIIDRSGRTIARGDLVWRELRAVLEVDSREFHFGEPEWKATMARHNRLTRGGLAVTHYPPSRISAGRAWADEVAEWLRGRARELGVAYRPDPRPIRHSSEPPPLALAC